MSDDTPFYLTPRQTSDRQSRDDLREMWKALADASDQDALIERRMLPTDGETTDLLLADAEAECLRLHRLIASLEKDGSDTERTQRLLDIMMQSAMAIRALRDGL